MNDAYLAGLLEGEGSIMLLKQGPRRARRLQIAIGITERDVLEAIREQEGGFITDHGNVPQWRLNGQPAHEMLERLRPFMVMERRKAMADLLLNDPILNRFDRHGGWASKVTRSESAFVELKRLNALRISKPPALVPSDPIDTDHSYLAGILDGEGHISFERRRIEVTSTDPELCAWLASRFGGNVYLGRAAKGNRRTTWRWLRSPTGAEWAARVAEEMRLERKSVELMKMDKFARTPAPGLSAVPHPGDQIYMDLRRQGVLRAPAMREAGDIPLARAKLLDVSKGLPKE